jgi:hypothetical protein
MTPRMQTLPEFLSQPRPQPEELISPWLLQGGIVMIYGERGGGKTNVTFALALAVACGTSLADSRGASPLRAAARATGQSFHKPSNLRASIFA